MNMVVRFTSFRLPSALVAWEGLAPVFTHHIYMVAALKSITLLTYPRLTASSGLLPRCFLHLCYDWSLCLAQLTPAYGVTSMCRFIQAATALSLDPTAVARCLCCHCGCSLFYSFGFLHSLLPPLDIMLQHFLASTVITLRPFTLSLYSWCILFVFAEGEGFEPPNRLNDCRVSGAVL